MEDNIKPRYRLYCPKNFSVRTSKGFDEFLADDFHSENTVYQQLEKYGTFMAWYQIVDIKNDFKVIKEKAPDVY